MLTQAQHASQARHAARSHGCADCIHYAPNAHRRADTLYEAANASRLPWYAGGRSSPYLLADGRMVIVCEAVWFFEPKEGTS